MNPRFTLREAAAHAAGDVEPIPPDVAVALAHLCRQLAREASRAGKVEAAAALLCRAIELESAPAGAAEWPGDGREG